MQLTIGNTQEVITIVAECAYDMGFIESPCQHSSVQSRFWLQDTLTWLGKRNL